MSERVAIEDPDRFRRLREDIADARTEQGRANARAGDYAAEMAAYRNSFEAWRRLPWWKRMRRLPSVLDYTHGH